MKQHSKYLIWLLKAGAASILTLVILSFFCYVYWFTGLHITSHTGASDYTWEPNQKMATMVEGFAWNRMDENGYNNSYMSDKGKDIDILLMGSSHMEAVNVPDTENTGYLLNELLPEYYTYNIGISGHTIYRCFSNLEDAIAEYHPSEWIVIETDRTELDIEIMQSVINDDLPPIKSYDSGIMYYLQKHIPALKLFYNQISDWIRVEQIEAVGSEDKIISEEYSRILENFLAQALSAMNENQKMLIVYQPQTMIDASGKYVSTIENPYSYIFRQKCQELGIQFLDLSAAFAELYTTKNILAHGFSNTATGSGHLNAEGHKVVAEEIALLIDSRR